MQERSIARTEPCAETAGCPAGTSCRFAPCLVPAAARQALQQHLQLTLPVQSVQNPGWAPLERRRAAQASSGSGALPHSTHSTHLLRLLERGGAAHALAVVAQRQGGGALQRVCHVRHRLLRHLGWVHDGGLQQAAHALEDAEQRNVDIPLAVGGNLLLQELVPRQVAVAEVELDLRWGHGQRVGE